MKLFALLIGTLPALFAQAPPLPVQPVPDLAIVAKVDGKDITAGEVRTALANMPPEFAGLFAQNPKYAVQQIFVMRHLAAEGEKAKLDQQSPTKEQLEMVRANILASAMVSFEHNSYIPTEKEMQDYYAKENQRFRKADIKVIALAFRQDVVGAVQGSMEDIARGVAAGATGQATRTEAQTRDLATDLMKQLREPGADFAKLHGWQQPSRRLAQGRVCVEAWRNCRAAAPGQFAFYRSPGKDQSATH